MDNGNIEIIGAHDVFTIWKMKPLYILVEGLFLVEKFVRIFADIR